MADHELRLQAKSSAQAHTSTLPLPEVPSRQLFQTEEATAKSQQHAAQESRVSEQAEATKQQLAHEQHKVKASTILLLIILHWMQDPDANRSLYPHCLIALILADAMFQTSFKWKQEQR